MLVKIEERNKEEILVVSSREIAEDFEKEHKHVLEAIGNITAENSALIGDYFIESKDVMKEIEKTKGKINPRYDIGYDIIKAIIDNSSGDISAVCNGFRLGYIQGQKSMRKGNNKII